MRTRRYRVIWTCDDKRTRGIWADGPLTHAEGVIVLGKLRSHPKRRDLLEEIQGGPS
jgi:hypothetical protein